MIYHECEYCGASLDPGEKCDCHKNTSNTKKGEEVHKK